MSPEPLPGLAAPPRRRKLLLATSAAVLALVGTYAFAVPAAHAADPLISVGKTATASSVQGADLPASNAVDGNAGTRWGSAWSDPQWIQIDLGATAAISQVVLQWEGAYAKAFQLQVSANGTAWTDVYSTVNGTGGTQTLAVSGSGRYIRMYGTQRNSGYGYSLYEFGVYGVIGGTPPSPSPSPSTSPGTCALASQGKPAAASSTESGTPAAAFDGSSSTRWGSLFTDPQWIQVDLGSTKSLCQVQLEWETASGKAFQLQVSDDAANWTNVYSTTTGTGGTQTLAVSGSGRYVRMYGTQRNTGYGYSLWEFKVYAGGGVVTDPVEPTDPMNPNLGPNTIVYDPSTPTATIQNRLNQIFTEQETNQFGASRYAVLFKPGTYTADVNLGFYTQVAGLGLSPDDVNLNGHVRVEALWMGGNATQNFWRTAENLSVTLPAGTTVERWAVAQAAAYRRMHLKGAGNQIQLWNGGDGWASGGLMADSKVDGLVSSGSQQQWFSRNSEFGSWTGSVWNMVFTGVTGAPAPHFPNPSHTVVTNSPVVREKPFLYIDGTGTYRVFKPGVRLNSQGTSWYNKTPVGTSISLADFYVVRPGATAATINNALAAGKNLLFTPGVYHLNQTLQVNRADTVVLGLGLATLIPDNGITAIKVADVDGVQVAGLLIDAGTANSATLMEMGAAGSTANHAANPSSLHDVYFRIGGAGAGKATTSLVINSNNVIGDHMWLWRADHGTGVGWTVNTADTGLIVNGNDVTMYGLFVEHYQKYEVIWNGNGGRTYFFQNELPYEAPNQAAWMNGTTRGYAAYKVADSVTTHEAWGVGSYCVFTQDLSIVGERGFEVPVKPGVKFHNLVIVSLGGQGTIAHVINNTGGPANTATPTVYLNDFSG
ncbi:coagulation factor 5/8 type [Catellatospora sp. TT07R-123]|uniref:discoidin domain-containing protein n=1 Tax=Catellatospora sp. TT07R-123 TaxID=2733863 RepID=UPI001B10D5C1|nr:discoidin domain-containing protein [Catellatospora sp. TT07R-123]GHJ49381.1 coagulation factor 5/8 type [Catellatospora sp. TT07R-123]